MPFIDFFTLQHAGLALDRVLAQNPVRDLALARDRNLNQDLELHRNNCRHYSKLLFPSVSFSFPLSIPLTPSIQFYKSSYNFLSYCLTK